MHRLDIRPTRRAAGGATLLVTCAGTATVVSSITAVVMGLAGIGEEFGANLTELQWIVNAFSLALAAALLTAGTLGDRYGHRTVFAGGLALFGVGSLAAGLAGSAPALIAARVGVGVGGAAVLAGSLALISRQFDGSAQHHALGVWGVAFGGGTAAGLLFGGVTVEVFSWRWVFLGCVPPAAILFVVTLLVLPPGSGSGGRVDWAGFLLSTAGSCTLVFALVQGNLDGWSSPLIVGAFVVSAGALIGFVLAEHRSAAPMLYLRLFADRDFTGSAVASLALFATVIGSIVYLVFYQLSVQGYSPAAVGLQAMVFGAAAALGSVVAKRLAGPGRDRFFIAGGLCLVAAGLWLFTGIDADSGWTALVPGYLGVGAGFGLAQPSLVSTALRAAPPDRTGMASGASNTFRQLGAPVGIAALGAVFQRRITEAARALLAGAPLPDHAATVESISRGETKHAILASPPAVRPIITQAATESFVTALHQALWWGAGIAGTAAVLVLLVTRPGAAAAKPVYRPPSLP